MIDIPFLKKSLTDISPFNIKGYIVGYDHKGHHCIICLNCKKVSYHPEDIKQKYCGYCHKFHDKGPYGVV